MDARKHRRARHPRAAAEFLSPRALAGRLFLGSALKKVLLTDAISPAGEEALAREVDVVRAPDSGQATIRRMAKDVDGILIRSKLPDDIFAAAPRVRAVAIHGAGTDLVPLESATARGVMVSNLPGVNAHSVAEYCAMAMLMLARGILPILDTLRKGTWDEARILGSGAREIAGMTAGIVGVGAIGGRVAKIARLGFGMNVLGHQRRLERLPAEASPAPLDRLLRESDFVVLACPLTPETRYLMNRKTFSSMKPGAWLINVGRGPVVQEEALIEALREKRIAGAMLDVYEHYRLERGHPLFALDNVILTPHLAAVTQESRARASVAAADEMLRMLRGERPRNLVNPAVLTKDLT
jgi:D-3-phosphoglycerate dehydrogenase